MNNQKMPQIRFESDSKGWKEYKLEQLVDFSRGQGLCRNDIDDENGTNECILYGNLYTDYGTVIENVKHKTNMIPANAVLSKGDEVLIPGSDTTPTGLARALCIVKENVLLGGDINILSPKFSEGRFLAYELNKYRGEIIKRIKGTTVRHLQGADIADLKLFITEDTIAQTKISDWFSYLYELISLEKSVYDDCLKLKNTLLTKMFPAKGKKKPKIRFKSFEDEWTICDMGNVVNTGTVLRVFKNQWQEKGIPFYRSIDVVSEYRGVESIKDKVFISKSVYDELTAKCGKVKAGDVLVTGGGSIGTPYLVKDDNPLYFKDGDLLWLIPNNNISGEYLYRFFCTPLFTKYVYSISHKGTIMHYTIEQVNETPFYFPQKDEQIKIASFFENYDELIKYQKIKIEKLQNIKSACMEKMFV